MYTDLEQRDVISFVFESMFIHVIPAHKKFLEFATSEMREVSSYTL